MHSYDTTTDELTALRHADKLFTPAEANSALVLVRRIVSDIAPRHAQLLALRDQRHELAHAPGRAEHLEMLDQQIEQAKEALNRLDTELREIGCVLKDWSDGLVDFPAIHEGRRVWLCWRLGEPAVTHWHELDAGFAGRQPIGPDFT